MRQRPAMSWTGTLVMRRIAGEIGEKAVHSNTIKAVSGLAARRRETQMVPRPPKLPRRFPT